MQHSTQKTLFIPDCAQILYFISVFAGLASKEIKFYMDILFINLYVIIDCHNLTPRG